MRLTELCTFFPQEPDLAHVFEPIETRVTCTIAAFINMHSALFALQKSWNQQPNRQHPQGTVCSDWINDAVRLFYIETLVDTFFHLKETRVPCSMAPFINI